MGGLYRAGLLPALLTSGFTPVPYFAYTLAAGAFRVPLLPFVAGAAAGRALKYLAYGGGARLAAPLLRRRLPGRRLWIAALAAALLVLAFLYFR